MARAPHTLTPKQLRFVEEFLVDSNATQAAIRAGYAPKTANREGSRLLSKADIQREIADRKDVRSATLELDNRKVLVEFSRLAASDMRDYLTWGPDGLTLKSSDELTDDQARAVAQVTQTKRTIPQKNGPPIEEVEVRFKLHDKKGALDSLAKAGGLFAQRDLKILDKVLDVVLVALRKFVPEEHVERAIIEVGSGIDRIRDQRAGAPGGA